jgi:hypothetical protein
MANWNIIAWAKQQFPKRINQVMHTTWLTALIIPAVDAYNNYLQQSAYFTKQANLRWQTIVMEAYLNDLFDNVHRRIKIVTETDVLIPNYVFTKAENQPLYVYTKAENKPVYIKTKAEYSATYNFTVYAAPGSLTAAQIVQLKTQIERYRYATRIPRYLYTNGVPF